MYFVPVRKLPKVLLGPHVSRIQETRWACLRRLLFVVTAVLICLCIMFYHNTQAFIIRRHVSTNYLNFDNRNIGHVIKIDRPNYDDENTEVDDILKHIDENFIKERNITPIVTATMAIIRNKCDELKDTPYKERRKGWLSKDKRRPTKNLFSEVKIGGYYYPTKCRSKHKVAILVPYRNRKINLEIFMYYMHPFLIKQQLEYRIFVIEQAGKELFNRGKLLNIGFTEMMRYNDWHCVVLHDVDFLPLSDKILYTCPIFPRHMLGLVDEKADLTYNQYHILFGGVTALSVQHYRQINGFSNLYWGWGGEDNDMYWRIIFLRLPMIRYHRGVAQYKALPHEEQPRNNFRYQLLKFAVSRYKTDGLSSLVYKVIWIKHRHLYTHILADVNPLRENISDVYRKMFS